MTDQVINQRGLPRPSSSPPPAPPADRLARPRWFDLRLVLGVLLVLGSVAAGSRLIAEADDTVPRLVAAADLEPGMPLTADQVAETRVRIAGYESAYIEGPVPTGYIVTRAVRAGELIPRSAVAVADTSPATRYVTLAIPELELPAGLQPADLVDVWVVDQPAAGRASAELIAAQVTVVDAGQSGGPFGAAGGERAVTVALRQEGLSDGEFEQRLATVISAGRSGVVYLTAWPQSPGAVQ